MKKVLALFISFIMIFAVSACNGEKNENEGGGAIVSLPTSSQQTISKDEGGKKSDIVVGKWAFGINLIEFKDVENVSLNVNTLNYVGTYTIEGDKIIMTVNTILGERTGEFTYSLDGDKLTLKGDITFMGGGDVAVTYTKQ